MVAILLSDKTDFKTEIVTRNKDHYIIKGTNHKEYVTFLSMHKTQEYVDM